jgi:hypothetical protein
MVAAAVSTRVRAAVVTGGTGVSHSQSQGAKVKKPRGSAATWVVIGVPVLLALTLVWQIGSSLVHTETAVRDAVAVSRVSLEADPLGSRIDFVVVDRSGQETTVNGELSIKLREPDGTVWQIARTVTSADFGPLPEGGLLTGRVGYSVVVPATDWLRAPRRGGSASVSISVRPTDGTPFSTVAEERFP